MFKELIVQAPTRCNFSNKNGFRLPLQQVLLCVTGHMQFTLITAYKCYCFENFLIPPRSTTPSFLFVSILTLCSSDKAVYVGADTWVPNKSYLYLLARTRESLFVREAAVILFSTAGLAGKSVTGISSNRTKNSPKPALEDFKFNWLLPERITRVFLKQESTFFLHYLVHRCKCNPKYVITCKCKVKTDCKCEAQHGCQIPRRLALLNKHVASKIMDIARREGRK
ncbi:unnamed protein product [Ixodes persulcatus]